MKRKNSEKLQNVIYQYLCENGLETPLNEFRATQAWSSIVGPAISKYTTDIKIYNQTMFVSISSSVVRNELLMKRTTLIKRVNDHVGAQVITQIVFK
jgi:predicted nucleic acid-binding Zn ribbon protein